MPLKIRRNGVTLIAVKNDSFSCRKRIMLGKYYVSAEKIFSRSSLATIPIDAVLGYRVERHYLQACFIFLTMA